MDLTFLIRPFLALVTHRTCACDTASIPICALKIVAIKVEKLGKLVLRN